MRRLRWFLCLVLGVVLISAAVLPLDVPLPVSVSLSILGGAFWGLVMVALEVDTP